MTCFWLSTHLAYACRHSGACCTAGWPIPIERDRAAAVGDALAARQVEAPSVWYEPDPEAPTEVAGVLTRQRDGACVFYRRPPETPGPVRIGGCAIHAHRPTSCRHFPYVCVIDPRGVQVTLSHFCPTAANLLFDSDTDVEIVEGPPVPLDDGELEGLDARESLPPVAATSRPSLMSWDAVTTWERALVARLAGHSEVPGPPSVPGFNRARAAVSSSWSWPAAPDGLAEAWDSLVAPEWGRWSRAIGRYLAARAHASWAMHLGNGPSDVERMVDVSRTVLQVEASRACLGRGARRIGPALTEALRRADLLLLHHADPHRLCTPIP